MLKLILIAGSGGFLGTVARYLSSRYIQALFLSSFPFGTFLVNTLGCLLIGIFYGISQKGGVLSSEWILFLTVGFCGGFTTFSAFAGENLAMLRDGKHTLFCTLYQFKRFSRDSGNFPGQCIDYQIILNHGNHG